jgi:hypothetical protein
MHPTPLPPPHPTPKFIIQKNGYLVFIFQTNIMSNANWKKKDNFLIKMKNQNLCKKVLGQL